MMTIHERSDRGRFNDIEQRYCKCFVECISFVFRTLVHYAFIRDILDFPVFFTRCAMCTTGKAEYNFYFDR